MTTRRLLLALIGAFVFLVLLPSAAAHAQLQSSIPAVGTRLDAAPVEVVVTLTERVDTDGTTLEVTGMDDRRADEGGTEIQNGNQPVLRARLRTGLPDGVYVITWKALSTVDGHVTVGTIGFAVGNYTASGATTESVNELDPGGIVARAMSYAGLSLGFGGAAVLLFLRPGAGGRWISRAAVAWGAGLHILGCIILVVSTRSSAGLAWSELPQSEVGQVLLWRTAAGAIALALALTAWRTGKAGPAFGASFALLVAAMGAARLAHGYVLGPLVLAVDLVHLVATTAWVGSLGVLLWVLRFSQDEPTHLLALARRYGRLALALVAALWATGITLSVAILGWGMLARPSTWSWPWTQFLTGKVLLATIMLAIAVVNRFALLDAPRTDWRGRLQAGAARLSRGRIAPLVGHDTGALRRTIRAEASVGGLVLVLAAFLTSISPPAPVEEPLFVTASGDEFTIDARLDPPPRLGAISSLVMTIRDLQESPLAENTCGSNACVQVAVRYVGVEGSEPHSPVLEEGTWRVPGIVWTKAGFAEVEVVVSSAEVYQDAIYLSLNVME